MNKESWISDFVDALDPKMRRVDVRPYDDADLAIQWADQMAFFYFKEKFFICIVNHSFEELTSNPNLGYEIHEINFKESPNPSSFAALMDKLFLLYT